MLTTETEVWQRDVQRCACQFKSCTLGRTCAQFRLSYTHITRNHACDTPHRCAFNWSLTSHIKQAAQLLSFTGALRTERGRNPISRHNFTARQTQSSLTYIEMRIAKSVTNCEQTSRPPQCIGALMNNAALARTADANANGHAPARLRAGCSE